MGEFSASDSSWKKMVISKTDNEWTTTMKHEEGNANIRADGTASFQLGLNPYANIKRESDEAVDGQTYEEGERDESGEPVDMVQEIDPLLVDVSPRRRRGSGGRAESASERSSRLAKMSAYAAQRLASETAEQRAARLKRMSEYAARRLASETAEQRARRLARMSAYAARRLARETPDQRRQRLTRMSAYAARRQALKKHAPADQHPQPGPHHS